MALDSSMLHSDFRRALDSVASRLRTNPKHLLQVMHFETGGTFSPSARNPRSGAVGLIQFLPSTAQGLGTSTEALAQMSPVEQLQYVEKYLAPYRGKLRSLDDVYAAVFAPASVGKPGETVLYSRGSKAYEQNRALDKGNKGYITRADATAAVMRTRGNGTPAPASSPEMRVPTSGLRPADTVAPRRAETEDGDDAGIDWSMTLYGGTEAPRAPAAGRAADTQPETAPPPVRPLEALEVSEPTRPAAPAVTTAQVAPGETDWSAVLFG